MDMESAGLSLVSFNHPSVLLKPFLFDIKFFLANMDIRMHTKTKLYQKDNHIYYNVTNVKVQYTISGLKLRLDNLFEGVKLLGEFCNNCISDALFLLYTIKL